MRLTELKQLIDSGSWTRAERTIRPFLGEVPQDKEIQALHRKVRLELSRLCEFHIEGFDYLGPQTYQCGGQEYSVAEFEHLQTGMDFVLLPPVGAEVPVFCSIGIKEEEREHSSETPFQEIVFSNPFLISKTVVTQKVWKRIMNENPSYFKFGERYPVEEIRWYDCLQFCDKVGLTPPTEAHWEYACRSGTRSAFCFGDSLSPEQANYDGFEYEYKRKQPLNQTTPVGSFPSNAFGIYDTHGNVWECCLEWEQKDSSSFITKVLRGASDSKQVFRGGSFSDGEQYCCSSFRLKNNPDFYGPDIGLRLMKILD